MMSLDESRRLIKMHSGSTIHEGNIILSQPINYKFNEGKILKEVAEYIDSTYDQHYAKKKIQQLEMIIDQGHGTGFCIGNIGKYSGRYGKKPGEARKDLMKVIHYGILMLNIHDLENEKQNEIK